LRKSNKQKQEQNGCESWVIKKPRAWVIRIPGSFDGYVEDVGGGFQTIVIAESWEAAWETAMDTDSWQVVPFHVEHIACFPKEVVTTRD
jgi:hypothetical protein